MRTLHKDQVESLVLDLWSSPAEATWVAAFDLLWFSIVSGFAIAVPHEAWFHCQKFRIGIATWAMVDTHSTILWSQQRSHVLWKVPVERMRTGKPRGEFVRSCAEEQMSRFELCKTSRLQVENINQRNASIYIKKQDKEELT